MIYLFNIGLYNLNIKKKIISCSKKYYNLAWTTFSVRSYRLQYKLAGNNLKSPKSYFNNFWEQYCEDWAMMPQHWNFNVQQSTSKIAVSNSETSSFCPLVIITRVLFFIKQLFTIIGSSSLVWLSKGNYFRRFSNIWISILYLLSSHFKSLISFIASLFQSYS